MTQDMAPRSHAHYKDRLNRIFRSIGLSQMQHPLSKLFCDAAKSTLELFSPLPDGSKSCVASQIEALEPKEAVMYLQNLLTPASQVSAPKYFAVSILGKYPPQGS